MGVSLHGGTPKSSILIGFSIINHPFWGTTIFWKPPNQFAAFEKSNNPAILNMESNSKKWYEANFTLPKTKSILLMEEILYKTL